jgi:hypothetical protein
VTSTCFVHSFLDIKCVEFSGKELEIAIHVWESC